MQAKICLLKGTFLLNEKDAAVDFDPVKRQETISVNSHKKFPCSRLFSQFFDFKGPNVAPSVRANVTFAFSRL